MKTVVQAMVLRFMNQSFTLYKHCTTFPNVTHSLVLVLKLETGLSPTKMGIYNPTSNREIFVGDKITITLFLHKCNRTKLQYNFFEPSLTMYCS